MNHDVLAFEYVTGVMRGDERKLFERLLNNNTVLTEQVGFWEEQLMQLSDESEQREPSPEVWNAIKAKLNSSPDSTHAHAEGKSGWPRWALWATPGAALLLFVSALFLFFPHKNTLGPNADYVAVLTDAQGAARLTVLTATKGTALWLKWGDFAIPADKNVQLWAISKSDGQIRPLGVFAQTDVEQQELSVPNWRLIKDAEYLLLTEEDVGGSPLDEPSDSIVAKGVCVLLAKIES
jgi:anti-sigma-K factor RskA